MMNTNALVLEISKHEDTLKMSVFEQQEAASTLKHYSQCRITLAEINRLCQELLHILNKANKKDAQDANLIIGLKKTGQLLWDHLLTRSVKDRLKATIIRDLALFLDEELINIPWELLYTGEDFLSLKFNLGRLVITKDEMQPRQYRSLSLTPLKMLILSNPTNDLKSAYQEGVNIKNQFDRKRKEIHIDFKSTQIDTLYVKKNLRDYDIVHFAGHGEYGRDNSKNTGWVLSDGRFNTQDILALGESPALPSLIFSNACYSAQIRQDLPDTDYQNKTYSLASAFLFSGVRHYIGAIRHIEDPVSFAFAKEFYTQLLKGESVGECIRLSRWKLLKEYGIGSLHWASYILYGDPGFRLFRTKPKPAPLKLKISRAYKKYKKILVGILLIIPLIFISVSLYLWLPSLNPNTYYLSHKSYHLFLEGRNQEIIYVSENILKKDPLFLPTYPLLADSYQRSGKPKEALRSYSDYVRYSEKRNDKKNLAAAYIGIGWFYQSQGEYKKAEDFYNKAITLSRQNQDKLNEALAMRKLAVWYIDKEDYNKALELLTKSSEINRERQHIYAHQYNLACDYFDIGLVFENKDDFVNAKEFYQKSQVLFEKLKLKRELSDCYFNLGETYLFEKQYQKALDCYYKGLKIDQTQGNLPSVSSDYNMIGELYVEMGDLDAAERFFNQAVSVAKQIKAPLELASAYHNLGLNYKERGQKNKAEEYLRFAGEIYSKIDTSDYREVKQELLELSNN